MLRRLGWASVDAMTRPHRVLRGQAFLSGMCVAAMFAAWALQWITTWGTSSPVLTSLVLSGLLGLTAGHQLRRLPFWRQTAARDVQFGLHGLLAVWGLITPWGLSLQQSLLESRGLLQATSTLWNVGTLTLTAALWWCVPLVILFQLPETLRRLMDEQCSRRGHHCPLWIAQATTFWLWLGAAAGVLGVGFFSGSALGLYGSLLLAGAGCVLTCVVWHLLTRNAPTSTEDADPPASSPVTGSVSPWIWLRYGSLEVILALAWGGLWATSCQVLVQLFPPSAETWCAMAGASLLAAAFAWRMLHRGHRLPAALKVVPWFPSLPLALDTEVSTANEALPRNRKGTANVPRGEKDRGAGSRLLRSEAGIQECSRSESAAAAVPGGDTAQLLAGSVVVCWLALLPVLFPLWCQCASWLSSQVNVVWQLFLARACLAGVFVGPIAGGWTLSASRWSRLTDRNPETGADRLTPSPGLTRGFSADDGAHVLPHDANAIPAASLVSLLPAGALGALGWWLTLHLVVPSWGPVPAQFIVCGTILVALCLRWVSTLELTSTWPRRWLTAGTVTLLAVLPMFGDQYQPALSAKTLFATNVFLAQRDGLATPLLPFIDEGRLVAQRTGERGIYTAWKYAGSQIQLRQNGIPKGVFSLDTRRFPQFTAEMLQAVYPLCLHDQPRKTLLLGLGSSVPLQTTLAFPVQQVVCAESDRDLVQLLRELAPSTQDGHPLDDDRLTFLPLDSALALPATRESFDVIISTTDPASMLHSQACFTKEFYRHAAERLLPGGIFAQRLQIVDFGPEPIRAVAATLQSQFRDVLAVELGPGELLFLATNDRRGNIRPQLLTRVQAPHVRQLLADLGFDWSSLLNLPAYRNGVLAEFAAERLAVPHSVLQGGLLFSFPREVMRWGPKLQEVQVCLVPRVGRCLDGMGEEANSPMLLRRLAEVRGQNDLMVKYADQYWAYRASLREQLSQHPLSKIQQTSLQETGRKSMHPEDRRRMNYFTALGKAVKSHDLADIRQVAEFAAPYDPLLTYFVHQEVAELLSQVSEAPAAEELLHRLHAVYYASPLDRSLRNILAALRLLRDHPEAVPEAAQRYDLCNALLQMLQSRWQARAGIAPANTHAVLADIEATLSATEQTLSYLDKLSGEANLPREQVAARRKVLEKTLIHPLQSYRTDILPHHQRTRQKEQRRQVAEQEAP